MDSDDNAGETPTNEPPHSHRRPGPAAVRLPGEQRFWKSVGENPRELMGVSLAVLLALAYGTGEVTSGGSVVRQILGVVIVGAGLLLTASYILQFHSATLESERWSQSPSRRAVRAVLTYTYGTYYAGTLLALLIWLIIWLASRL